MLPIGHIAKNPEIGVRPLLHPPLVNQSFSADSQPSN